MLIIFAQLPNLDTILTNGLMNSPNKQLRETFCMSLLKLMIYEQKDEPKEAVIIGVTVFTALFDTVIQK